MTTLKKGSTNKAAVKELQLALTLSGFLTTMDGDFGPVTQKNVKGYQLAHDLKPDGIVGPLTWAMLDKTSTPNIKVPIPTPISNSAHPHMDWLTKNLGQKEISGHQANPFIVDLFRYTSLKNTKWALSDETAWCAALVNAALIKNGFYGTNSALADSFNRYKYNLIYLVGKEGKLTDAEYGDIVTLGTHHVTFWKGKGSSSSKFVGRGGNQSNTLKDSVYSTAEIKSIHRPQKVA